MLKNTTDSLLVKGELSNEAGYFVLDNIKPGWYYLEIRAVGFDHFRSQAFPVTEAELQQDLGFFILKEAGQHLQAVTVTADRPFVEKRVDRTVVNIENSVIHAGASVLDVMEKLPAVLVNQDGLISLKGKQGVQIYIDGKPTQMSGQDLANMLRGMSSSSVQKIEIITNPPARYDAAGNAGIINIILKKNKREGVNGSVTAGYGQGRYEKCNSGITLGYKNGKYNLFANYNYAYRKSFNNLTLTRNFYTRDTLSTVFNTDNYIVFPFYTHTPRAGGDFYLSNKTTLSLAGTGLVNTFEPYADNHTDVTDGKGNLLSSFYFTNRSRTRFNNYSANAELRHQLDSAGRELVASLDYARYSNTSKQHFGTQIYDKHGNYVTTDYLLGDQGGELQIYAAKADYTQPLRSKGKLELGFKSSYVTSDNDVRFYTQQHAELLFDTARSSHFLYDENINAAYLNFSKEFAKLSIQAGVRAEHTNAFGKQLLDGQTFDRNYVQLFPSVFFDYKFNPSHALNVNLGRRVDRPAYQQLNPFRRLIDATTYAEGNPYLLPQLTYNAELTYTYKNMLFATLGYSYTYNYIADVLIQDAQKQVTVQRASNIEGFNYYNLNLVFSKKITAWWTTNSSLLSYYSCYSGTINNYSFNQGWPSLTFNTSNSFSLGKGFTAEVSFLYNHKSLYGVTYMNPNSNLSAGLQKSLFDRKATLSVNISDIYWNAYPSGVTYFGGVDESWRSRRETRVAFVNFTYRFGNGQTKMRRTSGADDEKKRAG